MKQLRFVKMTETGLVAKLWKEIARYPLGILYFLTDSFSFLCASVAFVLLMGRALFSASLTLLITPLYWIGETLEKWCRL